MGRHTTFDTLLGKTIEKITGADQNSEEVVFDTAEGNSYKMYHCQDCCESVSLAEVIGDVNDLIGNPILLAEEVSQEATQEECSESGTWTFYKLSTIKGSVTFRWLGESNGYYSESADFCEI